MRRIAALVLILVLTACGGNTWQDEINTCVSIGGPRETCYVVAGYAIHVGCQTKGYRQMAAHVVAGVAPGNALAAVQLEGLCPKPPPTTEVTP